MKKFILKTAMFVLPFVVPSFFLMVFPPAPKGDLIRLGHIMDIDGGRYRGIFKEEYQRTLKFTKMSDLDFNTQSTYTVLTIGDSFSEQENTGYQNYLAENNNVQVLHLDRYLHDNPIETLYGLLNGDVLSRIKIEYIVIQSSERSFIDRALSFESNKIIRTDSFIKAIQHHKAKADISKEGNNYPFFSSLILRFPLYRILYHLDDNAYLSPTYSVETTENLFSTSCSELLFYTQELVNTPQNNSEEAVMKLNAALNDLSKKFMDKGIKIIVLPSPDKFDIYYDYIVENEKYVRPLFFNHLQNMQKDYLYVNSKQILGQAIKTQKDIYYFDDTHWSPYAAKLIANDLAKVIR
jgi:hypothetical protein